ncbi:hypothetical protein [Micromonospora sicca]|uniref:hypothetical protein n=2 Tax=Micromonosporaceae TaxID=28056 RepID=UPI0034DDF8DA
MPQPGPRSSSPPSTPLRPPDLILLSCGFGGGVLDPLGRQVLTASAYGATTRRLVDAGDRLGGGRIAMAPEGCYSPDYLLRPRHPQRTDRRHHERHRPPSPHSRRWANDPLLDHQRAAVDEAAPLVQRISTAPGRHRLNCGRPDSSPANRVRVPAGC